MAKKTFSDTMHDLGKGLMSLFRGMQGLPPEPEDKFSGMIDVKRIEERTRVGIGEIYSHTYMRTLAQVGGEEWEILGEKGVPELEDHYFISKDGLQRQEWVMVQKKGPEMILGTQPLQLPEVQTGAKGELPKKGEEKK